MLIQGNIGSDKTEVLVKYYSDLIKSGISDNQILVIVLNSYRKADFIKRINGIIQDTNISNIYTFSGLCYNSFSDNWEFISKFTQNKKQNDKPNLCGLEVSQYIFKESIKTADFSDYISKVNLLHQLFRRYSLTVQNCLSNEDILKRSKLLGESFARDAQRAIDDYKIKTFKYNSFDYLRQLAVLPLIYNNTDYFKTVKYLVVDDADEFSYAFWQFTDELIPSLNDYLIAYDEKGSTRCGYLCAYKSGINDFIKKYSPEIIRAESKAVLKNSADEFFQAVKTGNKIKISEFEYLSAVKRLDMLQEVNEKIKNLLKNGVKEEEIAVITPVQDEVLYECLSSDGINFQILSGSEKLSDDISVKYIITSLKIINNIKISEYELKNILIKLLKIPFNNCFDILKEYKKEHTLKNFDLNNEKYNYAYTKFLSFINSQRKINSNISIQIKDISENLLKEFGTNFEREKFNFLLKEAKSFELAFYGKIQNITQDFITQIENSIISENPSETVEIKSGNVILSTPQKIIDFAYKTKYQLWIDISSPEWVKNDTGTLYNAWVLSKDWNKKTFTLEDDIALTNDKTARIIRKLMLCAEKSIMFFSSLYDNSGNENFGGIADFIETEQKKHIEFKIIPRIDQKPVLDYKQGKLGIMAVPGAGKTTILLALIVQMLKQGIKSSNIFVLTYMESAAKNFKEKIKSAMPDTSELPNISTIHGLALRIIKENGNYNKIGLDENFEICDDNAKENIIRGLFYKLKIDDSLYDNYVKCISDIKLACIKEELHSKYKEIQDFFNFFHIYNQYLKQNNLIDYDDMLCYAVEILEENPDIRFYYQNLCKYVIEDEAQDSTDIQQKLIGILTAKHNNLVRCGDINQAITSTFTNSNPEGFKNFINQNKKIEMVSSQRCSKPVFSLANAFIKEAVKSTNAFYNIQMQGTDKNPVYEENPQYIGFESENEEKNFIIKKIKEIKTENPNASIAVLLRLNSQVNDYIEFFLSNDIKTTIRTDCPAQKSIYKVIFSLLKIIQNPLNNNNIFDFVLICKQKGIYKIKQNDFDILKSLKTPFVNQNPDEINSEALLQLFFDIDYHLNNSVVQTDILALNIGLYYAKNAVDKSNAYMISTLIKRIEQNCNTLDELLTKLDYAAQKNSGTYQFFDDNQDIENTVNIMTMHKSKGDEFDFVFIPELNEYNYSTLIENVKLKSDMHFLQSVKVQAEKKERKSPEELKQEQINETLRLLYVGITRAKQTLYFTNAINYRRKKNTKPVEILQNILNL